MTQPDAVPVAIIGAGPAGLAAAEAAAAAGAAVTLFDAMPSVGRKFLLAGKGGLNLTHSEPLDRFLARYGGAAARLAPHIRACDPAGLRDWAAGLGIETFVGSSGRVFPTDFKAAPLLRVWLRRLDRLGVRRRVRHRWLGWAADGRLLFATPAGQIQVGAAATVLALGGASWPQLGSDVAWTGLLAERGIRPAPLRPANCGFDVAGGWSAPLRERFAGAPVKPVVLSFGGQAVKGELMLTATGIEGSPVYALSAALRDAIARDGRAVPELDIKPDWSAERLARELARPRGSRSVSSHLSRATGLHGAAAALVREVLPPATLVADPARLAAELKRLPLPLAAPRPLAEAISTAGGVRFADLDDWLMLAALPGVFAAGEMLDWEAPTGGYLLTACFATGRAAGSGAAAWALRNAAPCG